jgi:hypothetical protein
MANKAIETVNIVPLTREKRLYFRDQLREARARALGDAEAFDSIPFVVERLGSMVAPDARGLRAKCRALARLAVSSSTTRGTDHEFEASFDRLCTQVVNARNDAFHEGAFARHLTSNSIILAILLEDVLMKDATAVSDYMIRQVVCAQPWQPLSFVRQILLSNSYSYLPIDLGAAGQHDWRVICDLDVARFSRQERRERERRLKLSVTDAVAAGLNLQKARTCVSTTSVEEALDMSNGAPVLVLTEEDDLLGIATPFDLL